MRVRAEPGLSSFSGTSLGFAADLADPFLVFGFAPVVSELGLATARFRATFLGAGLPSGPDTSFKGTFVVAALGSKKLLDTASGSGSRVLD